jgi:hypothetical protein
MGPAPGASTPRVKSSQVYPEGISTLTQRAAKIPEYETQQDAEAIHAAKQRIGPDAAAPAGAASSRGVEWRVAHEGWADLRSSLRFYIKLMIPVFTVTIWMFLIFTALSWAVPNVLCNRLSKEFSVRWAGGGVGLWVGG